MWSLESPIGSSSSVGTQIPMTSPAEEELRGKINSLVYGVGRIDMMAQQVGTLRDGYNLRSRIQQEQTRCKGLTKQIFETFTSVISQSKKSKASIGFDIEKYRVQFDDACLQFQKSCAAVTEKYQTLDALSKKSSRQDRQWNREDRVKSGDDDQMMALIPVTDEELLQEQQKIILDVITTTV
eukprot:TRINITY_DN4216_c0_g1_i3.p1 TRINITY_DN4216_c0_g1~~TRINITY_DN4216_c0_g1_i3.p1  ORF type:complete len:182 (-),score=42.06 TRINITY_DN4216_c0_g1_i3:751-1296(-)